MLIAVLVTPLVIRLAKRLGALDKPGTRRVHTKLTPRLGGIAVFLAFLGTMVTIWFLRNQVSALLYEDSFRLAMILAAGAIMLALGILDDLRGLGAKQKLLVEVFVALILCAMDIRITHLEMPGVFEINFGWLSWPLTVIWIVAITNAINLIDGLDGLAAGIAAITCVPIAVFALASGQMLAACVMLSLLGALMGFLLHNFNPAKIFLGDSGSLFVGFLLSSLSVYCSIKAPMAVGLAAPLLALGLPLFDSLAAIARRFLERRSPFCPDSGHVHHKLLNLGLTQRRAVLIMYAVTLLAGGAGLAMLLSKQNRAIPLFVAGVAMLAIFFRIGGGMRIRRNLALIKQNMDKQRQQRRTKRISDELQVQVTRIENLSDLWAVLGDLAEKFDLQALQIQLADSLGSEEQYFWTNTSPASLDEPDEHNLTVRIPFRLGTTGPAGELYAEVPIRDNTELATQKIQHLGRLMDCVRDRQLLANPQTRQKYKEIRETIDAVS